MKIAYCDCFSGISGDMFLSALLDAGLPQERLIADLGRLGFSDEWELQVQKTLKGPIQASMLTVVLKEHDHEHHHHHHHRNLADISDLIESSGLPVKVRQTSLAVFKNLAEAEAQVHGTTIEEIHFHEVGAVDSIIDIVGAAVGLDYFGIERLYASALPLGSGQVNSQHGILPLPAPATLRLLEMAQARVVATPAQVELVTPTGAAILATLATFEQPSMVIHKTGTGAGQRNLPWPNILRLILGETDEAVNLPMVVIETNIDDMSPQVFGHVMGRLFSAGALDVYFTPIYMKKNRPATMLSVIARKSDEAALARLILEETTTFGMRVQPIYRYEAERAFRSVQTEYGEVPLKLKILDGKVVQAAPEYEVCARLANEHNVPLAKVYAAAAREAEKKEL